MAAAFRRSRNRRRTGAGQIFGRNLRRACAARSIDAARLAELTDRSRGSIARMLAGKGNPTLSFLGQAARSINVRLTDLLRGL
jgi:transcriptional regulator with XRE-family HTH domain